MLVVPPTDANFLAMFPNAIDDAEQRTYRDLQLLQTVVTDTSGAFVTGQRSQSLPSALGTAVVVNNIYAITPFGVATADLGTRNPLTRIGRDFLDSAWPSSNGSTVPVYYSMTTQTTFIVGPWPDQAYQMEFSGTVRPDPMSATNQTTILGTYFPDLWMAALMIYGTGYQQNFGAQGVDNPNMAVNWEAHYQTLLKSAQTEEAMKKATSQGWSPAAPAPLATPPRT